MSARGPDQHAGSVRMAVRSFLGPPAFFRPAFTFLAAEVAVGVAVLGNLQMHLASGWSVSGLFRLDVAPQADFGIKWGRHFQGAVPVQEAAGSHLLLVLCCLCLSAMVVLGTSLSILLASRWNARSHRRAVQVACGASSRRLQAEEVLGGSILALLGGLTGFGAGYLGKVALALTWPQDLSGSPFRMEGIPLLVVLGAFFLLVPAATLAREIPSGTRGDLSRLLGGGDRLIGARYPEGLRGILPAVQIGLSLTLLMGSSVVLRGVLTGQGGTAVERMEPVAFRIPVSANDPNSDGRAGAGAWNALLSDLEDVPGVEDVAVFTPGAWLGVGPADLTWTHCGACRVGGMWVPFYAPPVRYHVVTPDSFKAMGIPVTWGREFTSGDGPAAPRVAVVNASYARQHFDEDGPLGRSIRLGVGSNASHTVVGVVEDFGIGGLGSSNTPAATVFLSAYQHPPDRADLLLVPGERGSFEAGEVTALLEEEAGFALAGKPESLADSLTRAVSPIQWFAAVALALGLLTLGAAAFGIYSLAQYSVHLRSGEIGLRRALGAGPLRIAALVLGRSGRVLILGVFLGLEGSLLLNAGMQGMVSQGQGFDLRVFMAVVVVMALAAGAGTLAPAGRAARVPPQVAMGGSMERPNRLVPTDELPCRTPCVRQVPRVSRPGSP